MHRFVVMVDAGYLLHKGVEIASRKASDERRDLELADPPALIQLLLAQSRAALGLQGKEVLRVYWYDGVLAGGHTPQQRLICELPDVNFRAGMVNSKGQQKGVDSLIVTDLVELASNRAISDAALVTGDSDLAIGIELAQKKGVRIAVLGVEDLAIGVSPGQSREITDRADRVIRFGSPELGPVMKYVPRAAAASAAAARAGSAGAPTPVPQIPGSGRVKRPLKILNAAEKAAIDSAVRSFIAAKAPAKTVVDPSTNRIEASLDAALMHHVFVTLAHGALDQSEKIHARAFFRQQLGV